MKMLITNDMIDGFNDVLQDRGSILRIGRQEHVNSVEIILINENLLDSYIVSPNVEFYDLLKSFFKRKYGIDNLSFNNTGTAFWSFG